MIHSKYIYFLVFAIVVLLGACTAENGIMDGQENQVLPDGTEFKVTFGGYSNGMSVTQLRAGGDNPNQITDLRLLVFDENRRFLYSRKAVLGSIVDNNKPDADHLPDGKKDGISKIMGFTASLISSTKPRHIHFIANHNWDGFPQDYFIEGASDGELIAGMVTDKIEFWRLLEFTELQPGGINGKVVKMLRNNAKVSVAYTGEASKFTLHGFQIRNTPGEGTVAPFIFREDLTYEFPMNPDKPTIPAGEGLDVALPKPFELYPNGYDVFEQSNKGDFTGFVIMKGRFAGSTRDGYYKIDLTQFDDATGVTTLREIIRNNHYRIKVQNVSNEGYATAKDASNNPAGNNLFAASIELEDYPSVSDGTSVLEVEHLGGTFVRAPAVFITKVFYTQGMNNVKFYPSWNTTTDEYLDAPSVTYVSGDNNGTLSINIKKVPTDRVLEYSVNVVGKHPSTGSVITRKIVLFLRPPYEFRQSISTQGTAAGSKVTVKFEVPSSMSKNSFPFDVLVGTKELTPDLEAGYNNGMILVLKDGKYYYQYTVKDDTFIGKTISLNFIRNSDNAAETIRLTSVYYNPATMMLGNFDIARGKLMSGLPANAKTVPGGAALEIRYNGGAFVPANNNTTGIKVEMLDNIGTYQLLIDKTKILASDYVKSLTIRYNRIITNNVGSVTYDNETTKTLQQWLDTPDVLLARYSIVVKGGISYYDSYYGIYSGFTNPAYLSAGVGTMSSGAATGTTNLRYNPFTLTIPQSQVTVQTIRFSYGSYYNNYSLQELESNSWIYVN